MNASRIFTKMMISLMLLLALAMSALGYAFLRGEQKIDTGSGAIWHTYNIIQQMKDVPALTEGMLASQRAYILTGSPDFLAEYFGKKARALERLAALTSLTKENPAQMARAENLRQEMAAFTALLEKRAEEFSTGEDEKFLDDIEAVNGARRSVMSISFAMLDEEYAVLSRIGQELRANKKEYHSTLIAGAALFSVLILAFNAAAFNLVSRRAAAERSLKASEDRFAMAIEGANDGIFDWDIRSGEVFYSRRFFAMLGREEKAFTGALSDFRDLIHPDDSAKAWQYIERYLHREVSEYSDTFRMRHADGRWLWINSRGKAIFGSDGIPVRMVGANTDITFMKEYQERLKEEKMKAESASMAKSDFLAHMSHEIRTPLTAVSGISEIFLRNQDSLDEKQRRLAATLHRSTETLKGLINDLLDFAKIESGELELKEETCVLDGVLLQVKDIMAAQAAEKGLAFFLDDGGVGGRELRCDPLRLRQILMNLADNAVKFAEKGEVAIDVSRNIADGQNWLEIAVRDTGIGIAPENHELVFERFHQVDAGDSRRYRGSGLGLAIARRLAALMGGSITVESAPGAGSVFTLRIPWKDGAAVRSDADRLLERKAHQRIRASISGEKRILIAEDYEGNVVVVSYILEELGCAFDIARTGAEAVRLWKEKHYDVVLMDVQMPDMDGLAATAAIRRLETEKAMPRTPIIGMTAHALIGDGTKCAAAGMDSYFPKPLVASDLKSEILRHLRESRVAA